MKLNWLLNFKEVTKILLCAAQSSHQLVPPDVTSQHLQSLYGAKLHLYNRGHMFSYVQIIEPVIMTIANNFVTDRNSGEVMTVG